ncbi:carbohydrate ABC transporter permease [Paenibacillus sp. BC26]|uniref:carbohydrate ABC transporter permease n=1 Tax=Paenibacillus sp. BC26 TaxID=1881032 RepID=UPI0008EC8B91|nr:carbohydrate ABC transporter permease [Paenibacillus sp. BC26]SFS48065.1 multiple sugar transport system permease protein/putative aldouronate transport system permease protein [Paenibacillus sp. BC26]
MVFSKSWSSRSADMFIYLALIIIACISLFPLWYTIALSFSDKAAVNAGRVFAWPVGFNLTSYKIILEDHKFFTAFYISVKRVLLGGVINFVLTVIMAYPLARDNKMFPGRKIYMWYLVFCMLFSGGLIPLYMTVTELNLQNTLWSLVLPGAVPIFNVILIMNFFRNLPKELEEAAIVDGSGPWRTLASIFIPVSMPALATVTLFSIVGHWNSFFDGLIYMNKPSLYPLQTYIQQLVVRIDPELMKSLTTDQLIELSKASDKTLNSAKLIVAMIPLLAIYPFLQKYFVHGIVLGSVKE